MKCHYCGYEAAVPYICPECQTEHIRYFGTGTQKVEEEIRNYFQKHVSFVWMWIRQVKGAHEKLLNHFRKEKRTFF